MLQRIIDWSTRDWALKLTALALATLMWVTVRRDAPATWRSDIPVRVVNNDAGWVVADTPAPRTVTIRFSGPYRELLRTALRPAGDDRADPGGRTTRSRCTCCGRTGYACRRARTRRTWSASSRRPCASRSTGRHAADPRGGTAARRAVSGLRAGRARRHRAVRRPRERRGAYLARIDSLRLQPIDLRDRRASDTLD
jgi:hypothetical protein